MDRKITQDIAHRRAERRDLVKTADRSEKIRTYNYAQVRVDTISSRIYRSANGVGIKERVTDHRLGLSLMNLTAVMEGGGLHDFIDAMQKDHDEGVMEEMIQET